MKALWWFKKNQIAGMARPGFNSCRWFDLPFDEAMLMGWLGQHSAGPLSLDAFEKHLEHYLPKTRRFYELSEEKFQQTLSDYKNAEALSGILSRLSERSKFFRDLSVVDGHLHFKVCPDQLGVEAASLKSKGVRRIVSLTESHHLADVFDGEFKLHHIGIPDMGAPTVEQAQELAEILELAEMDSERIAVHCLAGIGRTSTMLIAAEILRGKRLDDLLPAVQKENPSFLFVGSQAEFLTKLAEGRR